MTQISQSQSPEVTPLISLVIPCYNEEAVISETIRQLKLFCAQLADLRVELVFVDDGSQDQTLDKLRQYALEDPRIRVISFARNFGHQVAITAGMDAAGGDAVVLIDADLQDPLDIVHQMIAKWREGYDVIYGTRTERRGESTFKLAAASGFYRILNKLSEVDIPLDTGDFRLMSRRVVDAIRGMPERDRFVRGMVSWVGFKQTSLPYRRAERFAGQSKYSLKKMLRFALDGIISFSGRPLQFSVLFGLVAALIGLTGEFFEFLLWIFATKGPEATSILSFAVIFLGGVQLVCLGVVGEYVGRIYNEVKRRPLYVVREYLGFEDCPPVLTRSPKGFSE